MAFLFEFVREFSADLEMLSRRIEDKMYNDPHGTLMQARLFTEHIVKMISKEEELEAVYPLKHSERIHRLYRKNAIDEDLYMNLEWIRKKGNKAAHDLKEVEMVDVFQTHKFLFEISVWYMQVYVKYDFDAPPYKLPTNIATDSNLVKVENIDNIIKPYVDKKLDDMWLEIQRQLKDLRVEKEKILKETATDVEQKITPSKELISSAHHVLLYLKDEILLIPKNIAEQPLTEIPLTGCSYLLTEFYCVGIDSLNKISEPLDSLHMKLKGVGTFTIEKFWGKLKEIEGISPINKQDSQNSSYKTITISEEIKSVFKEYDFFINNKTKKAAEFQHKNNKEIVYLLPNKQTTIVLHPETAQKHFDVQNEPIHSTAYKSFPKKIKSGKTPTNYGYAYKFTNNIDLEKFLRKISNLQIVEV